jgi:hypothetical protein
MKQCAQCHGPFGLTRRCINRFLGGPIHFCSLHCKETYEAEQLRRLAETRFRSWLSGQVKLTPGFEARSIIVEGPFHVADATAANRRS